MFCQLSIMSVLQNFKFCMLVNCLRVMVRKAHMLYSSVAMEENVLLHATLQVLQVTEIFIHILPIIPSDTNLIFILRVKENYLRRKVGLVKDLLRMGEWETLEGQRTIKAEAKLMFKILNKSGPKSPTDLFSYTRMKIHITVSMRMKQHSFCHSLAQIA